MVSTVVQGSVLQQLEAGKSPIHTVTTLAGAPYAQVFYVKCSELPQAVYNPTRLVPYQAQVLKKLCGVTGSFNEEHALKIPAVFALKRALELAKPASVSFLFPES